jgi:hypothetical protein
MSAKVDVAYVYGSALSDVELARDIDVLIIAGPEHHQQLFREVASVQCFSNLLIHPTIVTSIEFRTNPLLRELVSVGKQFM